MCGASSTNRYPLFSIRFYSLRTWSRSQIAFSPQVPSRAEVLQWRLLASVQRELLRCSIVKYDYCVSGKNKTTSTRRDPINGPNSHLFFRAFVRFPRRCALFLWRSGNVLIVLTPSYATRIFQLPSRRREHELCTRTIVRIDFRYEVSHSSAFSFWRPIGQPDLAIRCCAEISLNLAAKRSWPSYSTESTGSSSREAHTIKLLHHPSPP